MAIAETRFMRACRREPVDATPVWFMRQAGRILPEYRRIRERYTLMEVCRQPELCAEVTLQPVRRLGVDALQLFDSWVGYLSPRDYAAYVEPYSRRIIGSLRERGLPFIHFGTNTATLLDRMKDDGGTIIGVDWRIPLDVAWQRIGPDL